MREDHKSARNGKAVKRSLQALMALTLGIAIGMPAAAFAGNAYSAIGYATVGGRQYENRAAIYTTTGTARAETQVGTTYVTAQPGWLGARGRLFTSGGALSCESSTVYNSTSYAAGTRFGTQSCVRTYSGTWYSYGVTPLWNNSGYSPYYTLLSPNQNS